MERTELKLKMSVGRILLPFEVENICSGTHNTKMAIKEKFSKIFITYR